MKTRKYLALTALAATLMLAGCATAPRTAPASGSDGSAEPDLVEKLRERMKQGPLQRQERTQDKLPSAAAGDSSRSPTVMVDPELQAAAMAVAGDYARALGLMGAGKDDDAMKLMQQISAKAPRFSGPLVNQAVLLMKKQQYADAMPLLQRAVEINPRNPFAYNLQGVILREQGKFTDARAAYEKALAIDPNYAKAHFNLAVLAELYLQDLPLALGHYERYQSLQSKADASVSNWIVDLQKRTGVYKAPPPKAPLPASTDTTTEETGTVATPAPAAETAPAQGGQS